MRRIIIITSYWRIDDGWTFLRKDIGSKPETVVRILREILKQITVRVSCRVQIRSVQTVAVFGIYLSCQVREQIFVPHVFQQDQIGGVERCLGNIDLGGTGFELSGLRLYFDGATPS
jgi:hypothetical protein